MAYWGVPSFARCVSHEYRYLHLSVGARSGTVLSVPCPCPQASVPSLTPQEPPHLSGEGKLRQGSLGGLGKGIPSKLCPWEMFSG